MAAITTKARALNLLSDERFTVGGTQIEAWVAARIAPVLPEKWDQSISDDAAIVIVTGKHS